MNLNTHLNEHGSLHSQGFISHFGIRRIGNNRSRKRYAHLPGYTSARTAVSVLRSMHYLDVPSGEQVVERAVVAGFVM